MSTNGDNLEAFAISFSKLIAILDLVEVNKDFNVDVWVDGNSAMANAKGEAAALGPDSHTETLSLTTTNAVFHVGSASSRCRRQRTGIPQGGPGKSAPMAHGLASVGRHIVGRH